MNYIDYRKKLGIGFNNKELLEAFKTKSLNSIAYYKKWELDAIDMFDFCNEIAYPYNGNYFTYNDALNIIVRFSGLEYLSVYVAFINSLSNDVVKDTIKEEFLKSLSDCNILYDIVEDEDGVFVFPKGAEELDDALVSQPLEWLKDYPKSYATLSRALRQYSNGDYARDVADNFRKALEEFLQEFLNSKKNFDNNISEIKSILGSNGADSNVMGMLETLLKQYDKLNNETAKHKDNIDSKFLEFLMYQTGLFIRMIITTCEKPEEE